MVFAVGKNQRLRREGLENVLCHSQQFGSSHGNRSGGRSGSKTQGLRAFNIQTEKRLGHFGGGLQAVFAQSQHLPLSGRVQAMGIKSQQPGGKVAQGVTDFPQRHLQSLGLLKRMGVEQLMNRGIRGDKRQAVEQLETALTDRAVFPCSIHAQRRFVDQLQGQASHQVAGRRGSPPLEQIPSAQPQVLGNQKPQSNQVAVNLVGQKLANLPLDGPGVA